MRQKKRSAKEVAYDYISDKIIKGEYIANERIDDTKISEELGISKMPIREAIQLLVSQNFLTTTAKVGTTVTEIKIEDIYQLFEPLSLIHGHATKVACITAKSEDVAKLYEINRKIKEAIDNDDYETIIKLDEKFHNNILDLGNNPYIRKISDDLLMQIKRIEYLFLENTIITADSYEIHLRITEAIEDKNVELASSLMQENWLNSIAGIDIGLLSKIINTLK